MTLTFSAFSIQTQKFWHKSLVWIKLLARVFATGILLLVLMDWVTCGSLKVGHATLVSPRFPSPISITLPFRVPSHNTKGFSDFYFKLPSDPLWLRRNVRMVPDDCIRKLSINDIAQTLGEPSACDLENGIVLSNENGWLNNAKIHVTIEDTRSILYGLHLYRDSLLTPLQITVLTISGFYIFALTFLRGLRSILLFHYGLLVVTVFFAGFNPRSIDIQRWDWTLRMIAQGSAIAFVVAISALNPAIRSYLAKMGNLCLRVGRMQGWLWACICALVFLVITGTLSQLLFGGLPHVADTHVQYMQSKIFAAGKLYEPSHPLRAFFDFQYVINDGKYYSSYFPGHALILAIGQLLNLPWLVNPAMGALTVLAVYGLGREIGGKATGMVAAALMLVSPYILVMSSEYMQHSTCMLFLTLFAYFYIRTLKTDSHVYALLAGLAIGYAFFTRVHAAATYAALLVPYTMYYFLCRPKKRFIPCFLMLSGFLVWAGALAYYQYLLTGDPFLTGYQQPSQRGVGPSALNHVKSFLNYDRWFALFGDYDRAVWQYVELHKVLFNWPTSSLLFVFVLYLLKAQTRFCTILLLCLAGQFLGLIFVLDRTGSLFEPRFIYESTALLVVLSALCMKRLPGMMRKYHIIRSRPVGVGIIASWLVISTALAFPTRTNEQYQVYANNFWEGNADYYKVIMANAEKPALVFMKQYNNFRLVFFTQPPDPRNPVIFAQDRGGENQRLMDYYPDRSVYVVDDWDITKIRAGALPPPPLPMQDGKGTP